MELWCKEWDACTVQRAASCPAAARERLPAPNHRSASAVVMETHEHTRLTRAYKQVPGDKACWPHCKAPPRGQELRRRMGRPCTNPARRHRGSEGLGVVLITALTLHFRERFSKRRGSRIRKLRSSRCTSSTALLFPRLIDFFHPFEINKSIFSFTAILARVCFLHRSPAT